jgi:ABC-type polysaccharide/polyol phosphate export permease
MWLTPVVYAEKIFHDPIHPHPIVLKLLHFNPAYHYIEGFHKSLWLGKWLSPATWGICVGITVAANLIAGLVLSRCRAEIRDVL